MNADKPIPLNLRLSALHKLQILRRPRRFSQRSRELCIVGQVDNLRTDCQSVPPGNARPQPRPSHVWLRPLAALGLSAAPDFLVSLIKLSQSGRARLPLHFSRPAQIAGQFPPLAPGKAPEPGEGDGLGVNSPVGFQAPSQVRAAPRAQAVTAGQAPQKTEHYFDFREFDPLGGAP